jgi:NAD dependent epimerase/dehydratase family enzyme
MMTPGFLLRMPLGVTADTIFYGRHVIPRKALDLGYPFQFPMLESALRDPLQTPTA